MDYALFKRLRAWDLGHGCWTMGQSLGPGTLNLVLVLHAKFKIFSLLISLSEEPGTQPKDLELETMAQELDPRSYNLVMVYHCLMIGPYFSFNYLLIPALQYFRLNPYSE